MRWFFWFYGRQGWGWTPSQIIYFFWLTSMHHSRCKSARKMDDYSNYYHEIIKSSRYKLFIVKLQKTDDSELPKPQSKRRRL